MAQDRQADFGNVFFSITALAVNHNIAKLWTITTCYNIIVAVYNWYLCCFILRLRCCYIWNGLSVGGLAQSL